MKLSEVKIILNGRSTIADDFHHKTKINIFDHNKLNSEDWPWEWKKIYFKTYPRFEKIVFPQKLDSIKDSLEKLLNIRHSEKDFSDKPIKFSQLSTLLYYAAGIIRSFSDLNESRRFYPSAGARYPLEVYPFILNVKGLDEGIYHYNVKEHSLEFLLKDNDLRCKLKKIVDQDLIDKTALLLVVSAVFGRTEIKYRERGYRYVLIESGHWGQNVYLLAASLGLGCCAIGGYLDDEVNKLIDVDGFQEAVIYMFALGNIKG